MTAIDPPSRPINVLFLTKHLDIGGGEYVIRSLIERLDRKAVRPVLACLTEEGLFGRQLRAAGVPVYSGLLRYKMDFAVLFRLRRIVAGESIDLVYLTDYRDAMLWGALIGRLCGVPTIMATHSTDWWGPLRSPTLIGKKFLRWHARVVVITGFQRSHLVEHEGVPETLIEVIPNGIDVTAYRPRWGRTDAAPPEIPRNTTVIGTVAVLRVEKNLPMLLAAARRLIELGRDLHLVIVGDGDQRAGWQTMAQSMGLGERVHFLGYRDKPAALLAHFDIFTLTSLVEVMPISILEAMACGVPVVATAVGAVPEILIDGVTGHVIPSGDVDALVDRLARLADDPTLRRRMGEAGRRRVEERFAFESMVTSTSALMRSVVTAHMRRKR